MWYTRLCVTVPVCEQARGRALLQAEQAVPLRAQTQAPMSMARVQCVALTLVYMPALARMEVAGAVYYVLHHSCC